MLALAAEVAEDAIQIDFILEAVGPRVYSTAQLLDRAAVDAELTSELVQKVLAGQKSPTLKRFYLTVLRCDLEREVSAAGINPKRIVYRLDDPTLKSLLAETRGSQDYGLVHQAMVLAGFYSDRNPSAANFLQGLIQDPLVPKDVRLTALSSYATGRLNEARVQLAESLLRENGNPEIRKVAMNLLIAPADRTMTDPVRLAAVDILKNLAVQEKDPELRAIAVDSLVKMGRNEDAIAMAGQLIQAESDPAQRARFAKAFKDVSFQTREQAFSAQDLMIGLFKSDPNEAVRESAVDAYLQLVQSTILKGDSQTIDMQTVGGIERLVSILVSRPAAASTKALIRRRLESDYEKMFPDLLRTEQYVALKRSLLQE
ncbi:MAG: hypothetical protein JO332_16630 [Planctomycetaceae bacterium]|nr:hypothetical protein [Planctomycetaceae bacterium]